ncbi:cytochrome b561 [Rhizobium sp. NFR07]|uniref:cytochrome b n=1 Tax=Rhizobium sp. NFR07 TaxID=1566262 RepID=UPI0008E56AC4|nr:cytochrome b [Rhizobium sp. NFR07]SFB27718.1 cytochrome b561 [Rhizobium sp. NFR07]
MDQTTRAEIRIKNVGRYDRTTILFHWLTVALVLWQFGSSQIWPLLERGTAPRSFLAQSHMTLGVALSIVILLRLIWRMTRGRRSPIAIPRLQRVAANAVHGLLYCLLIAQAVLGYLFGWSQGKPFPLFGIPTITPLVVVPGDSRDLVLTLHENIAWIIIGVAVAHACVALFHHYVMRDGVLRSMLPGPKSSRR